MPKKGKEDITKTNRTASAKRSLSTVQEKELREEANSNDHNSTQKTKKRPARNNEDEEEIMNSIEKIKKRCN